jgi:hypothetical protein
MAPNGGDDVGRRSRDGRRQPWHGPLSLLIGLVLALFLAFPPAAAAFGLPRWGGTQRGGPAPQASGSAPIQEVAPPPAVQQLRTELAERRPRLAITAPADGALLPEGPWTLRLGLEDWPLVDAGDLGLGPHLRVQLDDGPAKAVTTTEVTMPSLTPGSHRLTVFAAWPWGEAVKDPGACRQIRLHRVVPNPLGLPADGSPQLLLASPAEPTAAEPVLLDWLLLDAPLQHLRDGDDRWRLRVTLNGDSFLVDRQEPLWLRGWRRGSNALLLELVDPRGNPLNPPFNSLVREVVLASADGVPWRGGRLSNEQLARLLGRTPPAPPPPPPAVPPPPAPQPSPQEIAAEPSEPAGAETSPVAPGADQEDQPDQGPAAATPPQAIENGAETSRQEPAEAATETSSEPEAEVEEGAEPKPMAATTPGAEAPPPEPGP